MPTNDVLKGLLRQMVRARVFEETMAKVYMEGKTPAFDIAAGPVPGEMHLAAEPVKTFETSSQDFFCASE
jgi:acetoin:2,6-dichlorophenolindophenol oxidoreductase subunit alpha